MNSLSTTAPAPMWLRELSQARASYEELFGWPVSVQVGGRNIVVALGQVLNAITMPAGLGARVRALLDWPVPVFATPDQARWTFLVGAAKARNSIVFEPGVEMTPAGSYLAIPADLGGPGWVEPPRPKRPLPPAGTVLALAGRLAYDRARRSA
ncbi:MAG TPA: hypothetical protein VFT95_03880 [Micromonosporaceae bacterium]|nr:hypothetical protein [Micromonosporaceae bacterium]